VPTSVPSVVVLSIDTLRADRLNSQERRGQSERVRLNEGTLEKLEALGYVEGDATPDPDEWREESDGH